MKRVEHQARDFGRVRDAHSSEIAEDYVELIADLLATTGDLRQALGEGSQARKGGHCIRRSAMSSEAWYDVLSPRMFAPIRFPGWDRAARGREAD